MPSQRETATRVYQTLRGGALAADAAPGQYTPLQRALAHAQAVGAAKVLLALSVDGSAHWLATEHQAVVSLKERVEIQLAGVELALADMPREASPEPTGRVKPGTPEYSLTTANTPGDAPEGLS
jgi:hypothetical protein